jgi:hypothetical protein
MFLAKEKIQLLGLDHPLVTAYLKNFRDLPPEQLGIRVQSPDGQNGVLAMWAVEARGDKGQVKRIIVPLAVDTEGKRLVAWERQPEKLWRTQPSPQPTTNPEMMLSLLHEKLEPMLQRELEYRGLAQGSRGYETKLIGWVEGVSVVSD